MMSPVACQPAEAYPEGRPSQAGRWLSGRFLGAALAGVVLMMAQAAHGAPSATAPAPPVAPHEPRTVAAPPQVVVGASTTPGSTIADQTRIVIEISKPLKARVSSLPDPDRLVLDFDDLAFVAAPAGRPGSLPRNAGGLVQGLRHGQFMGRRARVIVDLAQPARVARQDVVSLPGGTTRLVISLEPVTRAAFLATDNADMLVTSSAGQLAQGPAHGEAAMLPLVVIDPGHGGIDAGASSPGGDSEKALVLEFGLALRARLEKAGHVRVAMTRQDDSFLPLGDRVKLARHAKAALFLSIHADSLQDEAEVRGASVYTNADKATDERAARLADRENRADRMAGLDAREDKDEVADILFDLARRETRVFSQHLSRGLVTRMSGVTRMHKTPARAAAFKVLRAPDVPSVLLELGYMSSAEDVKMLKSEAWRSATVSAIADAIEAFVAQRLPSSTAALPPRGAPEP